MTFSLDQWTETIKWLLKLLIWLIHKSTNQFSTKINTQGKTYRMYKPHSCQHYSWVQPKRCDEDRACLFVDSGTQGHWLNETEASSRPQNDSSPVKQHKQNKQNTIRNCSLKIHFFFSAKLWHDLMLNTVHYCVHYFVALFVHCK